MQEVGRIGLKNLQRIFRLNNFSRHKIVVVTSRHQKSQVMSTLKTDFLVNLHDIDIFYYVSGIRMNTLLNLFQKNFEFFFLIHFL